MRAEADGPIEAVLVLGTLGAPERRRLRDRRGRPLEGAEPEPVPTTRATVVRPEPFEGTEAAAAWLRELRDAGADAEVAEAIGLVNRAQRGWRAAAAEPYCPELASGRALAVRVGFGDGESVAGGHYAQAWELPPAAARRPRRSMEAPEERFAALLGGRAEALVGEELLLRARTDLDAGRPREAALQARVALEALLAEGGNRVAAIAEHREDLSAAANLALRSELDAEWAGKVSAAVESMEAAARRHRLGGATR